MGINMQNGLTLSFKGFLAITDIGINKYNHLRPRVKCKDGFSVSIQRSHYHYCDLGMDYTNMDSISYPDDISKTSYELGYPSKEESMIMEYAEDPSMPTGTVYGHVPYDTVTEFLEKHGGIVGIVKTNLPNDDIVMEVINAIEVGVPEEIALWWGYCDYCTE